MATLKAPTISVLCASLLHNSLIPDESFVMDFNQMENRSLRPQKIELYFDYEIQFNKWPHEGYPCYGKHSTNIPSLNRSYLNLYLLSSGPQEGTFFLFSYLSNENHYMITSFIANINIGNFFLTKNTIFEKYKPNPTGPSVLPGSAGPSAFPGSAGPSTLPGSAGPSALPGSTGPSVPSEPPAPHGSFRPGVPPTPQINLMPSAPPQQYGLLNPSTSYNPPMLPDQPGSFTFPASSTTSAPATFFTSGESSSRYTFPTYQAAPAAPNQSAAPSSSHTLPAAPESASSDPSERR